MAARNRYGVGVPMAPEVPAASKSRIPVNRWVLKSPGHIWALDAMMHQYPDALVIQTHRDPLRTIASVSSLACTLRTFASQQTPIEDDAREWAEYVIDGIDRSINARESGISRRRRWSTCSTSRSRLTR